MPSSSAPRLHVLIDVEEEFDWDGEFDPAHTRASHAGELAEGLDLLAGHGLVPSCVTTWPVLDDPDLAGLLADRARDGTVAVGAHLHPWVTPPHEGPLDRHHSFPGNLPAELERAKLTALTERLAEVVGRPSRIYQAGRYGIGPHTAGILEDLGYRVDVSVCPPFDYSPEGGPDFSRDGNDPFWFGHDRKLLGLPVTGAFVGAAGRAAPNLYAWSRHPALSWSRLPGLVARLGLAERLRLSPEGHGLADMQRLTRALLQQGVRVFTLSFHSPSLKPGCTSYVRDAAQREAFLRCCDDYCAWFTSELGGSPAGALDLADHLATVEASTLP